MLQKKLQTASAVSLILLSFSACGAAAGKGSKSGASSSLLGSLSSGAAVSIASIYPSDGFQPASPTTVSVSFSSANLDQSQLGSITGYSMSCGGANPVAAQSVTTIPGVASVSVNFAAIAGLANGTVCTFQISNNLKDGSGNFVTGAHTAAYSISTTAASGTGGWTAALYATPTGSVGSMAGTGFSGVGADGMLLQGLLLNGSQAVDGIVGVWATRFAAPVLSYGQAHGASSGGYSQVSCPSRYRITGIYGKVGASINSLGIVCKSEDQTQTYRSASFLNGGSGTDYELSCPAGKFASELNGRAGSYLNQLSLGCR